MKTFWVSRDNDTEICFWLREVFFDNELAYNPEDFPLMVIDRHRFEVLTGIVIPRGEMKQFMLIEAPKRLV